MSDARELPERVWIDWHLRDGGPPTPNVISTVEDPECVPYLRADKPASYVVLNAIGEPVSFNNRGSLLGEVELQQLPPLPAGCTIHPVYIGPAIEPED